MCGTRHSEIYLDRLSCVNFTWCFAEKTENESAILSAATQAIGNQPGIADQTQVYGASDDEDKWSGSDSDMMEAATQAMQGKVSPAPKVNTKIASPCPEVEA